MREARRYGARAISAATASAASGPSISRHGIDDLLVELPGPFEISDGDLAVRALAQRGEEFLRGQRLHIAFALQRLLVGVHRIGDVDGDDQFDVDGNGLGAGVGEMRCRRGIGGHRQRDGQERDHVRGSGKTVQSLSRHGPRLP